VRPAPSRSDLARAAAPVDDAARWREILLYQAWCHLRVESERLYIGTLWWVVEPLLETAVLYVVFTSLLATTAEHYLSFLLCGLVSWRWFAQGVARAAPTILQNQPLAMQVFVPKLVFPLAILLADGAKFAVSLVVLFAFLAADGFAPCAAWAAFPLVLVVQFLLLAAVALWIAALVPFLRSLLVGLDVALRFAMFASGVFFDAGRVEEPLRSLLAFHPMATVLRAWREVLMLGRLPDFAALASVAVAALLAIAGVVVFVGRRERLYPRLPA
jgi:lipopolysaccharide transport system permease protein